jgi:hypothetical protein
MKQRVFKALAGYVAYRQMKKARKNAAIEQRDQSLYKRAFTCLKLNYEANLKIKNDRILWQAHNTNEEFFQVGITLTS